MLRTTSHFQTATKIGITSQTSNAHTANAGALTIWEGEPVQTSSSLCMEFLSVGLERRRAAGSIHRLDAVVLHRLRPAPHLRSEVLRERVGRGRGGVVAARS